MLRINVLGLASIAPDVTPDLARATIASVTVLGALHASPEVRAALRDRTHCTDPHRRSHPMHMAPLDRLLAATRLGGVGRLTKATAHLQRILQDSARRA